MGYRRRWVGLVFAAFILTPAVTFAQAKWNVTVNPGAAPVYTGQCTPIWLGIVDQATDKQPRNAASQLVTIADFDMTVEGGGQVVGRYNTAAMWSACACPGSAGKVARITATYPAKSLPVASRVNGVAINATTTVTVLARTNNGVPIGCESIQTKTNQVAGTAPWTVTLTTSFAPIPKGLCTPVSIDIRDSTGKDEPRSSAGRRVAYGDFSMTAAGNGVVGQQLGSSLWSVCACQAAAAGGNATINARYPAKAIAATTQAVPGVDFESILSVPIAAGTVTSNPAACSVPAPTPPPPAPAPAPAPLPTTAPVSVPPPAPKAPATAAPPAAPPPPTPTGQAPRNVTVTGNPVEAMVKWSPPIGPPNPTGYVVERWKAADPQCCRVISATLTPANPGYQNQWADVMMWPGPWYYQVTAVYADGLRGSAIGQYNYPEPQTPKNFKAQQVDKDKVLLTWDSVSGAAWYAFSGPPGNTAIRVNGTSQTQTGVALGKNTWQVATMYLPPERWPNPTPTGPQASSPPAVATLDVVNSRYRLVAEAIRVTSETADKPLSEDGIGDEIFVASFSEKFNRKSGEPGSKPVKIEVGEMRLSAVHGDYSTRFERRVQAGTGSAYGGIRSGNLVTPILTPQTMRGGNDPMVLWEGDLLPGKHDLVLHPTIWEADQAWVDMGQETDPRKCGFVCIWMKNMTTLGQGQNSVYLPGPQAAFDGSTIAVVEGDEVWLGHIAGMVNLELQKDDRPIGLVNSSNAPSIYGLTGKMRDRIVVLSSEKIEAALARGENKINVRFWDHWTIPNTPPSTINYLNGDYTLVIRIERVP